MPIHKNGPVILSQLTELVVGVLQSQVSQLHLVDNLFAYLWIHGLVDKLLLLGNFLVKSKLSCSKPHLVHAYDDKLSPHPLDYLFFRLTHACKGTVVALFEEQDEGAGPRRIVVSLNFDFVDVDTLKLLVVET